MSNLQYIGARYVPKFYQNPDYPAPDQRNNDWKSGIDYEALTIVTYNNDSYTSKKFVPAEVGNPEDNVEYWACTTKYTAALMALQSTVQNIENFINPAISLDTDASTVSEAINEIFHDVTKYYDSYNSLIADDDLVPGDYVMTLGYYYPKDGGGGLFKIVDTIDPTKSILFYTLNSGLYADCIDNKFVLPRYGGTSVHTMVDNARPFLHMHMRNMIILPPPNAFHPACDYYIDSESNLKSWFWTTSEPILIDENYAYSDIYLNGEISARSNIEAVLKISDARKPEDICFMTPVRVNGWHYTEGQSPILVDNAVLIEAGARVNFVSSLQAGYAKNAITLGGANQNQGIELFANMVEIGSCTEKAFNCDISIASYFHINTLRIQNLLNSEALPLYVYGAFIQSDIGQLFISIPINNIPSKKAFHIENTVTPSLENGLTIGTARINADILGDISNCYVKFGIVRAVCAPPVSPDVTLEVSGGARLVCDGLYFGSASHSVLPRKTHEIKTADLNSTIVLIDYDEEPIVTGRNIMLHGLYMGVTYGDTIDNGVAYNSAGNQLLIYDEGALVGRVNYTPESP